MFQPILINKPDLSIMSQEGNIYIQVTTPEGFSGTAVPTITTDSTMKVDNFDVCTIISIAIAGVIGEASYTDTVVIRGNSQFNTINNMPVILKDAQGIGLAGSSAKVTSCGQTSTTAE